jgi:hypothetical protein
MMNRPSLNLVPVIRAAVTVIVAVAIFFLMLTVEAAAGDHESMGGAFAVWATSATVGLLAWAFVFIDGVGRLRRLDAHWRPGVRWVVGAAILVLLLAAAATTFLLLLTAEMGRNVGNPGVIAIVRVLTVLGWIGATPWLLLLWITDERVRWLRADLRSREPADSVLDAIRELDAVWRAIERSSLALGLILSTLVINTALMRNVAIEAGVPPASFSQWEVIGYGVFFMVILAAILIPVLVGWRDAGFELVNLAVPDTASGIPDEAGTAARERLVVRIGIEQSYVRRPIAILGVLSPFLTSFVTALIPTGS